MTVGTPVQPSGIERFQDAILAFTQCVGSAPDNICSYGFTIGETYVPFLPDEDTEAPCDYEDEMCSQVWVRIMNVSPAPETPTWAGDSCALSLVVTLEVGVLRCIEIPEGGEAPSALSVSAAGLQAIADMNALHCAAMGCEVWDAITTGSWDPIGPMGGQYGGMWTFTVEL